MFRLIPYRYKTLILPIHEEDLSYLLNAATETPNNRPFYENKDKIDGLIKFKGIIQPGFFSISKKSKYPQPFIPLVKGTLDSTPPNTIIHMTFKPFPSTQGMVSFWTITCILIGCLFLSIQLPNYSGISFLIALINYGVALANFKIHTNDTIKDIEQTLSWD